MERRQDDLAQRPLAEVGRVVVAPALGEPVAGQVLGRRDDRRVRREVRERGPLEAADAGLGDPAAQVRVLARALDDPAPPAVARDVDHRGERPVQPGRRGLPRADACRALDGVQVPRRGLGERDREHGAEAVDHVVPEDERDAQARLVDGHLLRPARVVGAVDVQERADAAGADVVLAGLGHGRPGHGPLPGKLRELAQLFFEGHLPQQVLHKRGLGLEVVPGGVGRRLRARGRGDEEGEECGGEGVWEEGGERPRQPPSPSEDQRRPRGRIRPRSHSRPRGRTSPPLSPAVLSQPRGRTPPYSHTPKLPDSCKHAIGRWKRCE